MTPPPIPEVSAKASSDPEVEFQGYISTLEGLPANIMLANSDRTLVYMNSHCRNTLQAMSGELQEQFGLTVDTMIGQSIDRFHGDEAQRIAELLKRPDTIPDRVRVELGRGIFELKLEPALAEDGRYIGTVATWEEQKESGDSAAEGASLKPVHASGELSTSHGFESGENSAKAKYDTGQTNSAAKLADEVNENVKSVAASVEQMSAVIQEISESVNDSSKVAGKAVVMSRDAGGVISQLSENSRKVDEVIKVILGIASQINILALNATIEAARAGDAGRGFAVVATEVKELAKETAKATENISIILENIRKDADTASTSIEEIEKVVVELEDTSETISIAVDYQSGATEKISRNMADAAIGVGQLADIISGARRPGGASPDGEPAGIDSDPLGNSDQ